VTEAPDKRLRAPDPSVLAVPTAELDIVEGRGTPRRRHGHAVHPPQVRLGALVEGGIAPAIMAIVERGVRRRPGIAMALNAEVEMNTDGYPPVRIVFGERLVLVEDGPAVAPDVRVEGALPDLISLMVTPMWGGLPNPINARGRAAIGMVVLRRVRIEGKLGLMRRLLGVIRI
jgi:hypothetical protein